MALDMNQMAFKYNYSLYPFFLHSFKKGICEKSSKTTQNIKNVLILINILKIRLPDTFYYHYEYPRTKSHVFKCNRYF